jgi:hypothetical protein
MLSLQSQIIIQQPENTTTRPGAKPPANCEAMSALPPTVRKLRHERPGATGAGFLTVDTFKHQLHRPIHIIQIDDTTILIK